MEQVTDRLFKVEDDAGKERLVRGVDAKEIEAVKVDAQNSGEKPDVIAQADEIIESNKERAEAKAEDMKDSELKPMVEGVETKPETLLRHATSDFPKNDALLRESQNNPPKDEVKPKGKK